MDGTASVPSRLGPKPSRSPTLAAAARRVSESCVECLACVRQCGFLTRHGTPKALADRCHPENDAALSVAYECSLCGLCAAVCPSGVDPGGLHLEMRREAVERGVGPLPEHGGLLAYESRGTSPTYSFYALPHGCTTVFFPGCGFSGTRSEAVLDLQRRLEKSEPNLGIVLDCCTKPSHDLGRDGYFRSMFGELRDYLVEQGVKVVLVACPSCHDVFRRYGAPLRVRSIYEVLADEQSPQTGSPLGTVTVHDPCVARHEGGIQESVRALIRGLGLQIQEAKCSGSKTLCCGEGGGVEFVKPELARRWRRRAKTNGQRLVTYCTGCATNLGRHVPTSHVVDLVLGPEATLTGGGRVARPPLTYWKRRRLKGELKKRMAGAVTRERTYSPGGQARAGGRFNALTRLAIPVGAIAAVCCLLWLLAT